MLEIKNLDVTVINKKIISGLNLKINDGEIHVIMGKNGTGKSTIGKVLMRQLDYKITKGSIKYQNKDLKNLNTTEVARLGMFLLNQTPIEVEGITNAELLRTALSEKNKESLDIYSFNKKLEEIHQKIELPQSFIHREVNVGMSGGEKKKNELVHLWMLEPNFLILDEIDSGLDVDALKIVVKSLQEYYKTYKPSILIITHQIKLIDLFTPDYVHIMSEGKIIKSGDSSLAKQIEKVGFKAFVMKENKLKE